MTLLKTCHKISAIHKVFVTMTLLKTLWSNVLPNPHVFQPLILFLKRTKLNFQTFRHGGGCLGDQSNSGEPWTFCKETSTHWKASGETSLQIPPWRLLCHHQGYRHSLRYLKKKQIPPNCFVLPCWFSILNSMQFSVWRLCVSAVICTHFKLTQQKETTYQLSLTNVYVYVW